MKLTISTYKEIKKYQENTTKIKVDEILLNLQRDNRSKEKTQKDTIEYKSYIRLTIL